MQQRNMDKLISDFVMNSTGNRYDVKFFEPDVVDSKPKQDEIIKKMLEQNAVKLADAQSNSTKKDTANTNGVKVNTMPEGYKARNIFGHSKSNSKSSKYRRKCSNMATTNWW